ncbi:MAG: carbohydrate binding family 9 domain-containing protein [Verrucomicrobia bacterium]|nr:carbohydrate binding family 9 domain-containing protein [Verrucomicrobiota bacterium]
MLLTFSAMVVAHDDPSADVPSFKAIKVDAELVVDGALDEEFWADAPVTTGFIDERTKRKAEEQTLARIAYTDKYIYIAVECLDSDIEKVYATERREDRDFDADDWVEVHIDPMHSHRMKYAFFSNPLGTKADAKEGPSGDFNRGWTAEWDLEARILEDRWVFEMRIPFSILNYQRSEDQTWGINFTRMLRRTDTLSFWSFNPTDTYKPRYFGHLTGLDLEETEFDRNWETSPYISGRYDFNGDTDTTLNVGLDLSFRLTPSITTSWALNPDFGQVEADEDTIALRDTERFLPEKRLFFREGSELMRMPHRLYYSRRFTDINAGGKVSGQWDGLNFSVLNIHGELVHDDEFNGNTTVGRLMQNVGEKSSIGYYVTDSEFEEGHSRVVSSEGYLFITDAWQYHYQLSFAEENLELDDGNAGKDSMDFLGYSSIRYEEYPWEFSLGANAISKEFNPVLGYIPRRDIFGPTFRAEFSQETDEAWYKDLWISYNTQYYQNSDNQNALHDHSMYARTVLQNDVGFVIGHSEDYHRPYRNRRTRLGGSLFSSDYWKRIELDYSFGEFEKTDYHEIGLEKNFKPFDRLPIRYEFTIRFEDEPWGESRTVWLNQLIFDYYFTDKMWLKNSIQNRSTGTRNISVIYGWEFFENTFIYFVFNNVEDGEAEGNSVFSKFVKTF